MTSSMTPSLLVSAAGTLVLTLVYGRLFARDRERYLGIWALSWLTDLLALGLLLATVVVQEWPVALVARKVLSVISSCLLVWGLHVFLDQETPTFRGVLAFLARHTPKLCLVASIICSAWLVSAAVLGLSAPFLSVPSLALQAVACTWAGIMVLRRPRTQDLGTRLTGWVLIAWGIYKAGYSSLQSMMWLAPWADPLASSLRFVVAIGMLLIYFQYKRASLSERERLYRSLFEQTNVAMLLRGRDNRFVDVNPRACELLGYTRHQLLGTNVSDVLGHEAPSLAQHLVESAQEGLTEQPFQVTCAHPDGETLSLEASVRPIRGREDGLTMVLLHDVSLRKGLDRVLQEREGTLRALYEEAPNPIWAMDETGRLIDANRAALEFLGCGRSELLGKEFWDCLTAGGLKRHEPERVGFLSGGTLKTEYLANGTTKALVVKVVPCTRSDRTVVYAIGQDITKRRRAEKALRRAHEELERRVEERTAELKRSRRQLGHLVREGTAQLSMASAKLQQEVAERRRVEAKLRQAEEQVRGFIETADDIVCFRGLNGSLVLLNSAITRTTGFAAGEFVDNPDLWRDILHPDDLQAVMKCLSSPPENDAHIEMEYRLRTRRGAWRWIRSRMVPAKDAAGRFIGYNCIDRDITELKRAEQALRRSEQRYKALFDNAGDAVLIHSLEGRLLAANRVACQWLGYSEEELLLMTLTAIESPEYADVAQERMEELRHRAHAISKTTYVRRDGVTVPTETNSRIIDYDQSRVVLTIARDVSQRRHWDTQLRQAQKMEAMGRLAEGVARHFSNPLIVIDGYSKFLLRELEPEDRLHDHAREIYKAGKVARDLTGQLVAFSRCQTQELRVVDLNKLLQEMGDTLRRIVGEHISLEMKLRGNLGRVRADAAQIEQVVKNLVANARDAMPTGGTLTLETRNVELGEATDGSSASVKPGRYALLVVSDTGQGMPPEVQERIFEPFFTTKAKGKGTGLGLSTVYGIAKQHGGHIDFHSELGQGTTFEIYLPRVDTPLAARGPVEQAEAPRGGGEPILVVEDDEGVRTFG
ncbi:MAG: PAS domain S-box protein, partial [Anaerolineales bacterium]